MVDAGLSDHAVGGVVEGDHRARVQGVAAHGEEGDARREVHRHRPLRVGVRVDVLDGALAEADAQHGDGHPLAVVADHGDHRAAPVLKEEAGAEVMLLLAAATAAVAGQIGGRPLHQVLHRPAALVQEDAGVLQLLPYHQVRVGRAQAAEGGVHCVKVVVARHAHRQKFAPLQAVAGVLKQKRGEKEVMKGLKVDSPR